MKNLIKAQLYQIAHTRVYYLVLITFILLAVMFGAIDYLNGADALEEGQLLSASDLATRMDVVTILSVMGMALFASFICADDHYDKTANYEILSGGMRKQSFFARAFVSIVICIVFSISLECVSLITATLLTGWGDSVPVSAVVSRILLTAFPYFRLACLFVMLSYFIKRPGITFLAVYGLIQGFSMIPSNDRTGVLFSVTTLGNIMHYDEWHVFGLECDAQFIYQTQLDGGFAARCIIVSLLMGIAYLAIGYSYFHKDDLE